MSYQEFSQINRERAAQWHETGEPWSLADWSNAMCGEAGELANVIKKIRRIQTGTQQRYVETDMKTLVDKACNEIADVAIYLDLLLEQLDPDRPMLTVISTKFNHTSQAFNFRQRYYP